MPGELWIVDPSLRTPEDQGVETLLDRWNGRHRLFRPALRPGDGPTPQSGHEAAALVVLGSAASVHDEPPWLTDLSAWLAPVVAGRIPLPLLGVCFGHQLVAQLAGGRVQSMDGLKRVGVEDTTMQGSRLLPGVTSLRVVVSHREIVVGRPPGFAVTARRRGVEIDGLEHESLPVFSFQFHPEAREEFAARCGIPVGSLDDRLRADSVRLIDAFLALARAGQ